MDNEIREEEKNNKNVTGSATNKEYEHLNSTQVHLKDTHIPTPKKDKLLCGTEIEQKFLVGRQALKPQDYWALGQELDREDQELCDCKVGDGDQTATCARDEETH